VATVSFEHQLTFDDESYWLHLVWSGRPRRGL